MKKFWLIAAALALAPLMATAAGPREVRKQVELSMLLEGTITVTKEGEVKSITIARQEEVPESVAAFVQERVAQWTFEPLLVDGAPMPARNKMALRVVAKQLDERRMTIGIRSASFDPPDPEPGTQVTSISLTPPRYPMQAAERGVAGTVYLVIKVGREGRAEAIHVEQVNLMLISTAREMARYREMLASASLKAARAWTFRTPTVGELADNEYWSVRVPVDFTFDQSDMEPYGQWHAYVPGPRETIPWGEAPEDPAFSPDVLAGGGVYTAGAAKGLRLLTPLDGG